jgi:hypothetical protein
MVKNIPDLLIKKMVGGKSEDNDTKNLTTFNFICLPQYLANVYTAILYVPMHDGWLGLEEESEVIINMVKEVYFTLTGYEITITKEKVDSVEPVIQKVMDFDWEYSLKLEEFHEMKDNVINIIKKKTTLGRKFYNNTLSNKEKMKFHDLKYYIKQLKKNLREYKKLNKIKESVKLWSTTPRLKP